MLPYSGGPTERITESRISPELLRLLLAHFNFRWNVRCGVWCQKSRVVGPANIFSLGAWRSFPALWWLFLNSNNSLVRNSDFKGWSRESGYRCFLNRLLHSALCANKERQRHWTRWRRNQQSPWFLAMMSVTPLQRIMTSSKEDS